MITVDFNRLNINPGYRILDLGCGSGRHICAAMRFKQVLAMGIDKNFDDVLEARNRLKLHEALGECDEGLWWVSVADILELPFKDNFFDLVICAEVLEHIFNSKIAVAEMMRVLKPGRNLVVSVPRYLPERICWTLSESYHTADNGHVRIYRKKELMELLTSAGALSWSMHYAHSLHTPYWWLKCWVGPDRQNSRAVNLYHRFLVWDMMKHPWITRLLEHLLNPLLGKSIVIYSKKVL
jgi:SAM-dependent methyltransferase